MKTKTSFMLILGMLIAFTMVLTMAPTEGSSADDGDVVINSTNFPDAIFRTYVSVFDTYPVGSPDGKLSTAELDVVTEINANRSTETTKITSLIGVGYFTKLTKLDCSHNELTELDVSNNTALTKLDCVHNKLTSLDVSNNTALTRLWCQGNYLTSLDVSNNTKLTELACGDNQLTSLDVSKNTKLIHLSLGNTSSEYDDNPLTSLDVSKNTLLTELDCRDNQLISLDVSKNTKLILLWCQGNNLTSLDVSKNTALTRLNCGDNLLTSLDVSKNTALTSLVCYNSMLTSLDVSKNTLLDTLNCRNNLLTSLDVSNNTALAGLNCSDNLLTSLDVSNNAVLRTLNCSDNSNFTIPSAGNTFDLSTLPGFDVTQASNFVGGTVSGNILTITATNVVTYDYDCGNSYVKQFNLNIVGIITGVDVNPVVTDVAKGATQQFTAIVTGMGVYDNNVTWTVTGGVTGTTIDASGLLSVDPAETATSLTVTATSIGDTSKFGTASVTVVTTTPVTNTLTVTNGTGDGNYASGALIRIVADAAPSGQQFKNWTTSDGGIFGDANSASTIYIMPANAATVTANYELISSGSAIAHKVKVTFDPSGGLVYPTSKTVTYGQKYGSLPTPEKDDYDFMGWYYHGNLIDSSTKVDTTKDHTLTAMWSESSVSEDMGDDGGSKQYTPLIIVFAASALMFMMLLILAYIRKK